MKKLILLTLFAALAMPQAVQADLIVGVDQFRSSTTNLTPANYAVQDGVDVLITRSGTDEDGASATPGVNALGSTDGTIGSVADSGVSTAQISPGESFRWVNGAQSATFDFAFTDTSGANRTLSTFHFDGGVNRPNVAQDFELFLVDGGGETSLGSGTIPLVSGGAAPEYTDFNINLSNLAFNANSTVNFSLRFTRDDTSTNTGGHNGYLDNVGLSIVVPEVVPEPSSLALLGLAGFGMLVRRRK